MRSQDNGDNRLYYTMYRCVTAPEWRQMVVPFARPAASSGRRTFR